MPPDGPPTGHAGLRPLDGELSARRAAAQQRAAQERLAWVDDALQQLPGIAATKKRNGSTGDARASTTDPDARVMKMADGGFRRAYNVRFATGVEGQAIVGVAVTNGGEPAQLVPMLDQVATRASSSQRYTERLEDVTALRREARRHLHDLASRMGETMPEHHRQRFRRVARERVAHLDRGPEIRRPLGQHSRQILPGMPMAGEEESSAGRRAWRRGPR